jgi:Redoxin/Copper type II ascorbate-dependent monooxygenase, C-terminal domain
MLSKSAKPLALRRSALLGLTCLALLTLLTGARGDSPSQIAVREVRGIDGRVIPLVPSKGGATALVFYSTECPISNEYSPILAGISESLASPGFAMVGICVDPDLSRADVARHAKEFGLKFPVALDRDGSIAAKLGIKVTPESIVVDAEGKVRYQGRIDDTYASRGKRRANPSTSDLKDAIAAVLAGREIADDHVEAIGCPIPVPPNVALKPTFAKDVAPILQKNCQQCHRPGQVGPFSLVTYDQARKRADDVAEQVSERKMPPWKPDPTVGPGFKHSKALSAEDIATIAAWAEAGAPEGNPADMPPPPVYPEGWALGTPDLVLEASDDFAIPAEGGDIYRCFVIPTNLPEDKYISAIEYQPGNRKVVHHVLAYVDTTGVGRKRDEADPGLGYSCFSGPGIEIHGDLGGWAPGNEPSFLPEGVGRSLPKKADVVMQLHYHPSGKPETDRTRIGIFFAKKPVKQILHWSASLNMAMKIPAGAKNHLVEAGHKGTEKFGWVVPMDVTALSVTPHMHKLGHDMTMTVTYPDGQSQDLIRINDWDFNWQNNYFFEKPIDLPKGTILKISAHYDNTTDKEVKWGEATSDEMCIGFISVVQKGQDLTRSGEKDELGEYFRKVMLEHQKKAKEAQEKAAAAKAN